MYSKEADEGISGTWDRDPQGQVCSPPIHGFINEAFIVWRQW